MRKIEIFLEPSAFVPNNLNYDLLIPYGTLALMVRYLKELDISKAVLFLDLIVTREEYNMIYGISQSGIEDDEITCVFDAVKLQECINFFDDIVIPSLEQESQRLFITYGGEEQFIEDFGSIKLLLPNLIFSTWKGDEFNDDPEDLAFFYFTILKAIFAKAIEANQPYRII